MDDDPLDYPRLVREALVGVARHALRVAAELGLLGEHHFYLSLRASDPDVVLPKHLRTQYPQEMTIELQHQSFKTAPSQPSPRMKRPIDSSTGSGSTRTDVRQQSPDGAVLAPDEQWNRNSG